MLKKSRLFGIMSQLKNSGRGFQLALIALAASALLFAACEGPQGADATPGPKGDDGSSGKGHLVELTADTQDTLEDHVISATYLDRILTNNTTGVMLSGVTLTTDPETPYIDFAGKTLRITGDLVFDTDMGRPYRVGGEYGGPLVLDFRTVKLDTTDTSGAGGADAWLDRIGTISSDNVNPVVIIYLETEARDSAVEKLLVKLDNTVHPAPVISWDDYRNPLKYEDFKYIAVRAEDTITITNDPSSALQLRGEEFETYVESRALQQGVFFLGTLQIQLDRFELPSEVKLINNLTRTGVGALELLSASEQGLYIIGDLTVTNNNFTFDHPDAALKGTTPLFIRGNLTVGQNAVIGGSLRVNKAAAIQGSNFTVGTSTPSTATTTDPAPLVSKYDTVAVFKGPVSTGDDAYFYVANRVLNTAGGIWASEPEYTGNQLLFFDTVSIGDEFITSGSATFKKHVSFAGEIRLNRDDVVSPPDITKQITLTFNTVQPVDVASGVSFYTENGLRAFETKGKVSFIPTYGATWTGENRIETILGVTVPAARIVFAGNNISATAGDILVPNNGQIFVKEHTLTLPAGREIELAPLDSQDPYHYAGARIGAGPNGWVSVDGTYFLGSDKVEGVFDAQVGTVYLRTGKIAGESANLNIPVLFGDPTARVRVGTSGSKPLYELDLERVHLGMGGVVLTAGLVAGQTVLKLDQYSTIMNLTGSAIVDPDDKDEILPGLPGKIFPLINGYMGINDSASGLEAITVSPAAADSRNFIRKSTGGAGTFTLTYDGATNDWTTGGIYNRPADLVVTWETIANNRGTNR